MNVATADIKCTNICSVVTNLFLCAAIFKTTCTLRPAQEAYRPRRIKYSICCPVRGGVPPPRWGYPPTARSTGGGPEVGYPPVRGTPWPGLMGGTRGGVPIVRGRPPPPLDLAGLAPPPGSTREGNVFSLFTPGGVPPGQVWWEGTPHQTWLGYPPPPQVWTNWKHYLPSYYIRGR